jgi:ATP-dependent helicase HrpB
LALWGAAPDQIPLLTQPNPGSYAEAQALLAMLGALDGAGHITKHGRALSALPLHPRLAHMLALAGPDAAPLAALLSERDPLPRSAPADLALRLKAIREPKAQHPYPPNRAIIQRIAQEARRLRSAAKGLPASTFTDAEMAALAYPDRIGLRRPGDAPRYLLSGGKGALLDGSDTLAGQRLTVVTDTDGNPREAHIRQAIALTDAQLRALYAQQITWSDTCAWSRREQRVLARQQERFGALVLEDRQWKDAPQSVIARAMLDGVREIGLIWTEAASRFAARVALGRGADMDLPCMDDSALLARLEDWLLPFLADVKTAQGWRRFDITEALRAQLNWTAIQALDTLAPPHFTTPLERRIPIDYGADPPEIQLRLQEMFGQTAHPMVGKQPLRVTLLSPAGRPVQTTLDIPGFWASSYADVRRDMRGRYPRHPWPKDPSQADPTLRVKPRK